MIINLKVKTLDSQTYEFTVDNEITIKEFKDTIAEKTNISAEQQRIIYCGRVLVDEKQLKEYDVDGKVLHVVERPPPASRISTNTTRTEPRHMEVDDLVRGSPIFRALDGIVLGTMTVPMGTAGQPTAQPNIPPLTPSASFCMNRITVARHMLDCANNIAAYLENPERGLNNASLDILTQGRWTMESTVVEVGISAGSVEIPQNQDLVEALQGAVQAALQNSGNTNVTVVQLPTVFGSSDAAPSESQTPVNVPAAMNSETTAAPATADTEADAQNDAPSSSASDTSATSTDSAPEAGGNTPEDDEGQGAEGGAATADGEGQDDTSADGAGTSRRQRTNTRVLADVILQMRTVQVRLEPFVQQYYEILRNEPTFEENDTTGRESAQRIFDRVSEAMHYMSHAQHAISDLMLDLSRPAPRYLCCRPILVEQSGFVSSNNYLASVVPPNGNNNNEPSARSVGIPRSASYTQIPSSTAPTAAATGQPAESVATASEAAAQAAQAAREFLSSNFTAAAGNNVTANNQLQVARLIQAVVNSAPLDADVHVEINAPNVLSIGVPIAIAAAMGQQHDRAQGQNEQETPTTNATSTTSATATPNTASANAATANNSRGSSYMHTPRVAPVTLPTTSTQTRSTARPQVHVGNMPPLWNARVIPANMVSSFDRFLPCSSHHIREGTAPPLHRQATRLRSMRRRAGNTRGTPSRVNVPRRSASTSSVTLRPIVISDNTSLGNFVRRLRNELQQFIMSLFGEIAFNEENMSNVVTQAIQKLNDFLIFLPQYDRPDYDSRASVENFIRNNLPVIINMITDDQPNNTRYIRELIRFVRQLIVILITCIGRSNAEIYWNQILEMIASRNQGSSNQDAIFELQRQLMTDAMRDIQVSMSDVNEVQQHLVIRRPPPPRAEGNPRVHSQVLPASNLVMPMETDESIPSTDPVPSVVSTSSSAETLEMPTNQVTPSSDPLPNVIMGSEPWHGNFPSNWLPIITRDVERQRRSSGTQTAFSDAYISGMSAKRRKLVQSSKPQMCVRGLIADGVRHAMHRTGTQNANVASSSSQHSTDDIPSAIASDPALQASYCEALRSSISERLRTDPDFKPEKFPNTSKYFSK